MENYCPGCGALLNQDDLESGSCMICGVLIPDINEPTRGEHPSQPITQSITKDESVNEKTEGVPKVFNWIIEGNYMKCPVCNTSYKYNADLDICEKCIESDDYENALWAIENEIVTEIPSSTVKLTLRHTRTGFLIYIKDMEHLGREYNQCFEDNTLISRKHAVIIEDTGNLYIMDLGSENGVYLNGARIKPYRAKLLNIHDKVRLDVEEFEVVNEPS